MVPCCRQGQGQKLELPSPPPFPRSRSPTAWHRRTCKAGGSKPLHGDGSGSIYLAGMSTGRQGFSLTSSREDASESTLEATT